MDLRLERVTEICLGLPQSTRQVTGEHAGFIVGGRTFAYFLNDHHGDGVVAIVCKAALGENEELVGTYPERYYLPAYLSHRGWTGLRLDVAEIDWDEVASLIEDSYCLVAPKRLVKQVREWTYGAFPGGSWVSRRREEKLAGPDSPAVCCALRATRHGSRRRRSVEAAARREARRT